MTLLTARSPDSRRSRSSRGTKKATFTKTPNDSLAMFVSVTAELSSEYIKTRRSPGDSSSSPASGSGVLLRVASRVMPATGA